MQIRRLVKRITCSPYLALAIFLLGAVIFPTGGASVYAIGETEEIHVKEGSGECREPDSEWHFVITGIESRDLAPSQIWVEWGDGGVETVPLDRVSGKMAHYPTTSHGPGADVVDAWTYIFDGWDGQFNISHRPCSEPRECLEIDGSKLNASTEEGVRGWKIYLATPITGEIDVPAKDTPVVTGPPLENGKKYIVGVWSTYFAGDTIEADAECSITKRIAGDTWTPLVSDYESYGDRLLDLILGGVGINNVFWGECNNSHSYSTLVAGSGNQITFQIYDFYPANNRGSLTVQVFEVLDTVQTDENGDYGFDEVCSVEPFYLFEETKSGWTLVSPGSGFYQINGEREEYIFINQPPEEPQPICGDGKINQQNEECDDGELNGQMCEPGYEADCEYCSTDCTLETVKGPYCGDGVKNGEEDCDGDDVPEGFSCTESCTLNPTGAIYGCKFHDLNQDGRWDQETEPTLSGWTINLSGGDQTVPTTTGDDGCYVFAELPDGEYVVSEVLQTGWEQTYPAEDGTHTITIVEGESYDGADFGNYLLPPTPSREPDLEVEKEVSTETTEVNTIVTYTIIVSNTGETVLDITVTDVPPAGFTYVTGSALVDGVPSEPTLSGGSLIWELEDVDPGTDVTITYQMDVGGTASEDALENTVFAASGEIKKWDPAEVLVTEEEEEGEVLGVQSKPEVLAETGAAPVRLLIIWAMASAMLGLGLILRTYAQALAKKNAS